jgi:hypothetical protein
MPPAPPTTPTPAAAPASAPASSVPDSGSPSLTPEGKAKKFKKFGEKMKKKKKEEEEKMTDLAKMRKATVGKFKAGHLQGAFGRKEKV